MAKSRPVGIDGQRGFKVGGMTAVCGARLVKALRFTPSACLPTTAPLIAVPTTAVPPSDRDTPPHPASQCCRLLLLACLALCRCWC